jgi:hypothetical protein
MLRVNVALTAFAAFCTGSRKSVDKKQSRKKGGGRDPAAMKISHPSASRPAEGRIGKPFEIAVRRILRKSG